MNHVLLNLRYSHTATRRSYRPPLRRNHLGRHALHQPDPQIWFRPQEGLNDLVGYAIGGSGGGLAFYMDQGHLHFEYNLMIVYRSLAKSADKIAPGKHTIVVDTTLKSPKPGAPADIVLSHDGKEVTRTSTPMTVPALFTASETPDFGVDLV